MPPWGPPELLAAVEHDTGMPASWDVPRLAQAMLLIPTSLPGFIKPQPHPSQSEGLLHPMTLPAVGSGDGICGSCQGFLGRLFEAVAQCGELGHHFCTPINVLCWMMERGRKNPHAARTEAAIPVCFRAGLVSRSPRASSTLFALINPTPREAVPGGVMQ